MKKSPWIVCTVAVLFAGMSAQISAFGATTNAVYNLTSESIFKVSKYKVDESHSAAAVFLSDGTCSLLVGGSEFTGTYTVKKNQVVLSPDVNGLAAMESNVVSLISSQIPEVSVSVKRIKFSKISIKNGVPTKATDSVTGKLSATVNGKLRSKGFSLKTLWTNWTLVSGTAL